jgi:hypothetical protein
MATYNRAKYPKVGPNYEAHGEVPGYIYWPWNDQYYRDPKAVEQYAIDSGLKEKPKGPPSLMDTVLPVAGTIGAVYAGKELGGELTSGILSKGKDLLGLGGKEAAKDIAATEATQATANNPGLLSAAGNAAATEGFTTGSLPAGMMGEDTGMFFAETPSPLMQGAGALGVGLGGWQAYEGIKKGNPIQAGLGGLGGVAGLNAMGYTLGPWGVAATIGLPVIASLFGGDLFNKPSVRERIMDRWKGLSESGDPAMQAYAKQYLEYLNSDKAKVDAQEGNTFGAKKKAGTLKPEDTWGGFDIIQSVPGYLTDWTEEQRRQYNQELINQNLITSEEGDLKITDRAKAQEIANQIKAGTYKPGGATPAGATPPAAVPPVPKPGMLGAADAPKLPPRTAQEMAAQQQVKPGTQTFKPMGQAPMPAQAPPTPTAPPPTTAKPPHKVYKDGRFVWVDDQGREVPGPSSAGLLGASQ